ncbi:hypothetical protein TSAR_013100 [Trichomalopsis sarcophagae]|uniref:Uncharacterized protein n=1 Tax=Trichomalopsis sarcophagae TaxID=543379 RepID=A0A232EZY7_9HYME|nr:hypothetical protein TSAR_013100 [Trichomalopsis sarcophagae]
MATPPAASSGSGNSAADAAASNTNTTATSSAATNTTGNATAAQQQQQPEPVDPATLDFKSRSIEQAVLPLVSKFWSETCKSVFYMKNYALTELRLTSTDPREISQKSPGRRSGSKKAPLSILNGLREKEAKKAGLYEGKERRRDEELSIYEHYYLETV